MKLSKGVLVRFGIIFSCIIYSSTSHRPSSGWESNEKYCEFEPQESSFRIKCQFPEDIIVQYCDLKHIATKEHVGFVFINGVPEPDTHPTRELGLRRQMETEDRNFGHTQCRFRIANFTRKGTNYYCLQYSQESQICAVF